MSLNANESFRLQEWLLAIPTLELARDLGIVITIERESYAIGVCPTTPHRGEPRLTFLKRLNRFRCRGCGIGGDAVCLYMLAIKGIDEKKVISALAATYMRSTMPDAMPRETPALPLAPRPVPPTTTIAAPIMTATAPYETPPLPPTEPPVVIRPVTESDLKKLFELAARLRWPDGCTFSSADGKALLKASYGTASAADLSRREFGQLYHNFGRVLVGQAILRRDAAGTPYIEIRPTRK